jgi:hypothetical protein
MDVHVQVKHLLIRARTGRMPHRQPVARKCRVDGTGNASGRTHHGGGEVIIGIANIAHVAFGYDQHVAGVPLAQIDKGQGGCVFGDTTAPPPRTIAQKTRRLSRSGDAEADAGADAGVGAMGRLVKPFHEIVAA